MIRMKVGGMILTGIAAFLVADKALNTVNRAVNNVCEASKWKSYYKCWSRGSGTEGEPIAPGYSRSTRPDNANYEIIDDPSGKDHSEKQPEVKEKADSSDAVKAVCETVKAVADKVMDNLTKRSEAAEGAKEGQTEAFASDIYDETNVNDAIEESFVKKENLNKETDQNETVD